MAKNEKKSLETRKHEANLKLEELGVLDTVNAFLATQEAKAEVGAVFDNYLNGLKEFAAKMPDVAKEVTSKILEDIEKGKSDCVEAIFLYFKIVMGDTMTDKVPYVIREQKTHLNLSDGLKKLWLEKIKKDAQELCEVASTTVKIDIAEVAFSTFKTKEHVEVLYDVLKAEPNGNALVALMKRRLRSIAARNLMMMMNPFFGLFCQS